MTKIVANKITFFGGKGGVGKSSVSSAFALALAEDGKRTLLVSTDPAHNLSDIFQQEIGSSITRVNDYLDSLEIDADKEARIYISSVKDNLKDLVRSDMVQEVHRQIDMASSAPGSEEAALFDRIVSIVLDEYERYDHIVFDTAPTGHTIRLLSLPEIMGVWIEGMVKRREKVQKDYSQWLGDGEKPDDPIYNILNRRKQRFSKVRDILLSEDESQFVFVLNPERLPILETKKAIHQLHDYHLHVKTVVVNKVLPDVRDSTFLQQRKAIEDQYLQMIEETFSNQTKVYIPLMAEDITTLTNLCNMSHYIT